MKKKQPNGGFVHSWNTSLSSLADRESVPPYLSTSFALLRSNYLGLSRHLSPLGTSEAVGGADENSISQQVATASSPKRIACKQLGFDGSSQWQRHFATRTREVSTSVGRDAIPGRKFLPSCSSDKPC